MATGFLAVSPPFPVDREDRLFSIKFHLPTTRIVSVGAVFHSLIRCNPKCFFLYSLVPLYFMERWGKSSLWPADRMQNGRPVIVGRCSSLAKDTRLHFKHSDPGVIDLQRFPRGKVCTNTQQREQCHMVLLKLRSANCVQKFIWPIARNDCSDNNTLKRGKLATTSTRRIKPPIFAELILLHCQCRVESLIGSVPVKVPDNKTGQSIMAALLKKHNVGKVMSKRLVKT